MFWLVHATGYQCHIFKSIAIPAHFLGYFVNYKDCIARRLVGFQRS